MVFLAVACLFFFAFEVESLNRTILEFKRKFETCDPADLPIPDGPIALLYAYNDVKPKAEDEIARHKHRGQMGMRLLDPHDPPLPPNALAFDLTQENETISFPSRMPGTQYQCKVFGLPNLYESNRSHIIRWDAQIDPRNVDIVHHMLAYECPQLSVSDIGMSGGCFDGVLPRRITDCLGAVGGLAYTFPPSVGLPIGPNTTRFVVLETHYNNPSHRPVVDSSGMRFWRTYELRPNEAGILEQGFFTDKLFKIPPKQQASLWAGYCPGACTSMMFPPTGIHLVGTILHAHLAGRALSLRHYRNGTELPIISNQPNYDFNFQDIDIIMPEVLVLPGDQLVTSCTYNTMTRDSDTIFGISTENEMCLSFTVYYPRVVHSSCRFGNYSTPNQLQTHVYCANTLLPNPEYALIGPINTTCTHELVDPTRQIPHYLTTFNQSHYANREYLDEEQQYLFYWNVDHIQGVIEMAVDVLTDGWVGLGFSQSGAMPGSDVSIGWVGCDGSVNHRDRFAYEHALPPIDAWQDYFDIRGGFFSTEYEPLDASTPLQCPDSPSNNDNDSSLTSGEKAGLAVGVLVAVALTAAAVVYLYRKHKRQRHELEGTAAEEDTTSSGLMDTNESGQQQQAKTKKKQTKSYSNLET